MIRVPFQELHGRHNGWRFEAEFDPPSERGITWSFVSSNPFAPQRRHRPPARPRIAFHSARVCDPAADLSSSARSNWRRFATVAAQVSIRVARNAARASTGVLLSVPTMNLISLPLHTAHPRATNFSALRLDVKRAPSGLLMRTWGSRFSSTGTTVSGCRTGGRTGVLRDTLGMNAFRCAGMPAKSYSTGRDLSGSALGAGRPNRRFIY
jgi:hypothetical protein